MNDERVSQAESMQQSGANEAADLFYPDVSLLHWLVCRHGQLNRELDKLGPLLVRRDETILMMSEMSAHKRDERDLWRVNKAIASQLLKLLRMCDEARQTFGSMFEDDWSDDAPF